MHFDFGFGFEHVAATLATLLGRQGFEVVNPAAAVGLAAAVGGWAALASALRPRLPTAVTALVAVAVASPVLVLPFAENYTTQFVSICLWPFALAAFALLAAAPGWRRLVVAALAGGSVLGVYPAMAPWLVLPIVAIALLLVPSGAGRSRPPLGRLGGPGLARAGRARRRRHRRLRRRRARRLADPGGAGGPEPPLTSTTRPSRWRGGFYSDEAYAALFLGYDALRSTSSRGRASAGWG